MKNKVVIILVLAIVSIFLGCNHRMFITKDYKQDSLERRTERLIKRQQKKVDTIYRYGVAFNYYYLVWYHEDNYIQGFYISPHHTKRYTIEAKKINMVDDMNKYFENPFLKQKQIECFEMVLVGEGIEVYIKNRETLFSSIDTYDCLFRTKFEPNSFPYILQYDFYKLGWSPKKFNFEEFYAE